MEKVLFKISREVCDECSMALRRFMGHMEGVESTDAENGGIAVSFDETKTTEDRGSKLSGDRYFNDIHPSSSKAGGDLLTTLIKPKR